MARPKRKHRQRRQTTPSAAAQPATGWISLRTGLVLITLISAGLGIFVSWQLRGSGNTAATLVWSLAAAFSIWAVFGGVLWLGKRVRRTR